MAWWLMPRTPDPEVGASSPTRVKPCCVLEQGIFTPQKVLVIPNKWWLRPNMTENLFTVTLRINQPTNLSITVWHHRICLYIQWVQHRTVFVVNFFWMFEIIPGHHSDFRTYFQMLFTVKEGERVSTACTMSK